jgi:hypothetical protein
LQDDVVQKNFNRESRLDRMYDLKSFGLQEMIESGKELRRSASGASSMQQAANRVVDLFYDCFRMGETGESCCALVRCFKTHPLGGLPVAIQRVAGAILADPDPPPAMRCLVLLASRGDQPEWNSPELSAAHRVIPLPSARIVAQAPMIARLIVQMGLEIKDVVHPKPGFLLDSERQPFHVFHVEEAAGSEYVPAQEIFVIPYRVRSVVGFGGILPTGELFAVVLFSKVPVARETAALFRTLALSVKLAFLPFSGQRIFHHEEPQLAESR